MEINSLKQLFTTYRRLQRKAELCARVGVVKMADCRITTSSGEEVEGYIRIYGDQKAPAVVSWQFKCTAAMDNYDYDDSGAEELSEYLDNLIVTRWEMACRLHEVLEEYMLGEE